MAHPSRVWFADAVEALWLKGLHTRMNPTVQAELRALGLELAAPLKPGYSAETIAECIRVGARGLFPELSEAQAIYRMGEIAVDQFAYSLLGRALFPMLRVLGWRRTVMRMQSNIRSSNNFIEIVVVEVAPDRFRLLFKETDGIPFFWKALTDRGCHHSGIPHASSEVIVADDHQLTLFYDLRKVPSEPFPGPEVDRWRAQSAWTKGT